jgi:outer membrane protein assembly factor BamE (lipoprotein component of BamABCDE complex)
MKFLLLASVAVLAAATPVYAGKPAEADGPNTLTHGMAQMTLRVGTTSQLEVVEAFGSPNITTLDAQGQEVWIYDRHATVSTTNGSSFSIGMLLGAGGGGVAGGGGLGFGSSKSKATQTQRTMTLIIKFGADKRVTDFKSRSSSF